ncbi:MAG: hypothetical protein EPN34_00385 [Burkholderiaceae bacterium]|nr:MAG: hypothetical protein EPN34_00385 [Burkholderiaceae bacterium]
MSTLHLIETGAGGNEADRNGNGDAIDCVTIRSLAQHMGETIAGQFIVDQQAAIAEGTPHLRLRLADATGNILAFVWPEYRSAITLPPLGAAASVQADVCDYQCAPQLKVRRLVPLPPGEVAMFANLLPGVSHAAFDALLGLERSLPAVLREFVARVLLDPAVGPAFITCRASATHHHHERGGLLRHSLENLDLIAEMIRRRFPDEPLSAAIGQVGYLFHDVGKIRTVGTTARPPLSWTVRHETHNLTVLGPHMEWLQRADMEAYTGLLYIFEYLATPASARRWASYFPAEVVAQFDGWSAAEFAGRGLQTFTHQARSCAPASGVRRAG